MDCLVPGRVLISPALENLKEYRSTISEYLGMPFDIEYSIRDVLDNVSERKLEERDLRRRPYPLVGRIPEGEEQIAAVRLAESKFAKAACPDFTVTPSSNVQPDMKTIDQAIAAIGAQARAPFCGSNCTVAILDTGVDGNLLPHPHALIPTEFDVTRPGQMGTAPRDLGDHGSLVAYIINAIAPSATLLSIRTLRPSGAASDVLAGLYLAAAQGNCDLINLSLSVQCHPGQCTVCKQRYASLNAAQLGFFFSSFRAAYPNCLLIAAAGNGMGLRPMAMPAAFADILAVGESDMSAKMAASAAQYQSIPASRYVLAPGGDTGQDLGTKQTFGGSTPLRGTSFATAFVTGVAARVVCGLKGGHCGHLGQTGSLPQDVLGYLAANAYTGWSSFNKTQHGLGVVRYQ